MKSFLCVIALIVLAVSAQAADVGVSVSVGQPGFYGRIDIGDFPQPQVIYREPVVIHPPAVRVVEKPLYLRVPPGHAKKWKKYCRKYDACGKPVYFVRDRWYREVYVPEYQKKRGGPDRRHDGPPRQGAGYDRPGKPDRDKGHGKGRDRD